MNDLDNSFDEWYKEAKKSNDDGFSAKDFFEAGQQSKQAEIDKLKMSNHYLSVQVIDAEAYSEHWKYQRDKLQKRIDDALEKCKTGIRKQGGDYYLELVEGILKGSPNNHIEF